MYSYICKACGNAIALDERERKLVCTGCGMIITDSSLTEVKIYDADGTCPQCGGKLDRHSSGDRMICPYCAGTFFLDVSSENADKKYGKIIPFIATDRESVLERFYIASDTEFAPSDFRRMARIKNIIHAFLPLYVFDVSCDISYSLEVGHTETRRVYSKTQEKYVDERYTVWEPERGYLNGTWGILTSGVYEEKVSLPGSAALSKDVNQSEFRKFCKAIADKPAAAENAIHYMPLYLEKHDVLPRLSPSDAWKQSGSSMLREEIESAIRKRYNGQTRNITWNGEICENKAESILYPVSFVVYDYHNLSDQLMILDGYDRGFYRGVIPISAKRTLLQAARWGLPVLLAVMGLTMFAQGGSRYRGNEPWLLILSILLGIILWVWLGMIKGTGGNSKSAAAIVNRRANLVFGIISAVLAILLGKIIWP